MKIKTEAVANILSSPETVLLSYSIVDYSGLLTFFYL